MKKSILLTPLLAFLCNAGFACTNLIVTKGASVDGSVMVTYAADSYTRFGFLAHYPAARHKADRLFEKWNSFDKPSLATTVSGCG